MTTQTSLLSGDNSLILLRGLPGSGKSTLASVLSEEGKYPCVSIDDYFTDKSTGHYQFEFDKNHLAYKACLDKTEKYMMARSFKIFVHNTFTFDWEILPYIKMAAVHDYRLFVITVEKYHPGANEHGVTPEQIQRMAAKYSVKLF